MINTYQTSLIKILDTVDSTNNYAMAMVHAGMATHGMAWFAQEQTGGKGQRGKQWVSNRGQNIILSIAAAPFGLFARQQFYVSASMALGCYDFFSKYAGKETSIKWPNDLYWNDKKAGGVLIENIFSGKKWNWAVIGIGININQTEFNDSIINPVSLQQITGSNYNVVEMAKELYNCIMKRLEGIQKNNFSKIIEEYNFHLYKKDCSVVLKKDNIRFSTVIKKVNEHGQLITFDAIERVFNWGEVEWVLETP